MLGNIEDIRDYHKKVMLPKMEKAVDNANLMRLDMQNLDILFTIIDLF